MERGAPKGENKALGQFKNRIFSSEKRAEALKRDE